MAETKPTAWKAWIVLDHTGRPWWNTLQVSRRGAIQAWLNQSKLEMDWSWWRKQKYSCIKVDLKKAKTQ